MVGDSRPPASHSCSCRAVSPVIAATSRELYVFFNRIFIWSFDDQILREPIRRGGAGEILGGDAALAVRRIGQRDALVVDQDVGVMIGLLDFRREPVDERDRLQKVLEG